MNHPFVDGNKRTALASGLSFLDLNGCGASEVPDEEWDDVMVDLVTRVITAEELAELFRSACRSYQGFSFQYPIGGVVEARNVAERERVPKGKVYDILSS
jgi:hypothetical protein